MNLSIIGSSGSVGQEIIRMFTSNEFNQISNLICFTHSNDGKKKVIGMISDFLISNNTSKIKITSDSTDLKNADICVLCAGQAVDSNINNVIKKNKNCEHNRDVLYDVNKNIVMYWIEQINTYAPNTLVILVTNPVSKLLVDIYNKYPSMKIVGCGVTNDTLRVRNEYSKINNNSDVDNLFVIGEHSLSNQTITLNYFNSTSNNQLKYSDFENDFPTEEEKKAHIKKLKLIQNELLAKNDLSALQDFNNSLPMLYKSYMIHRMAHFLYKTHISTSIAIKEIINAYISEEKMVSVELKYKDDNFDGIIGFPITFKNKEIEISDIIIGDNEKRILLNCINKYTVRRDNNDNRM